MIKAVNIGAETHSKVQLNNRDRAGHLIPSNLMRTNRVRDKTAQGISLLQAVNPLLVTNLPPLEINLPLAAISPLQLVNHLLQTILQQQIMVLQLLEINHHRAHSRPRVIRQIEVNNSHKAIVRLTQTGLMLKACPVSQTISTAPRTW
jgi:hypothetical protein